MQDLELTENKFDPNPYWDKALGKQPLAPFFTDLYDQNGYDLCEAEKLYARENHADPRSHRAHRAALRQAWFEQRYKDSGSVLNHALLFERKGFSGEAREELKRWADKYPVYHKLLNQKPKWGLDFSMDYFDREGNTIEVLHWEYDGFNHDEINECKEIVEKVLLNIDWDDAGREILKRKDEWYHLDFFSQSDYKCNYFGISSERFKMVVWK